MVSSQRELWSPTVFPLGNRFIHGVNNLDPVREKGTEDEESLGGGMIAVTRVMDSNAGRVSRRCAPFNGLDDLLSSWRFPDIFSFFYSVLQIHR